jgi:hypothetical protein
LKERTNLDIIINSVEDIEIQEGKINAVILKSGEIEPQLKNDKIL